MCVEQYMFNWSQLLKRAIFDDFKRLAVEARLKGFEQVT